MNKSTFIIFVIVIALVVIFMNTPSGHDQELIRQKQMEKVYSDSIKSIRVQFRRLSEHDSILSIKHKHDSLELIRSKTTADMWRKKYNHEKNTNRHFTDHAIDSMLAILPGR